MRIINPRALMSPRGYNHGMLFSGGRPLFIAGQVGWDSAGHFAEGLAAQFGRALENIMEVVHAAGGSNDNIARLTIFVKDKNDYLGRRKEIGDAYRKVMGNHYPPMSLVIVHDLLEDGALVEIEATAVIP